MVDARLADVSNGSNLGRIDSSESIQIAHTIATQLKYSPPGMHKHSKILHAQMKVTHPTPLSIGGATCLATSGMNGNGANPMVIHLLLSNQSKSSNTSMQTPSGMQIVVRIGIRTHNHDTTSEIVFSTPFPSTHWSSNSTMQISLPLDANILQHADMVHVKFAVRIDAALAASSEALEILLDEWSLDLWDTASFLAPLITPSGGPAAITSHPALKRKREESPEDSTTAAPSSEEKQSKMAKSSHSPPSMSINLTHQQNVRMHGEHESRIAFIQPPTLFGSLLSIPLSFSSILPCFPPRLLTSMNGVGTNNSFRLVFALPALVDAKAATSSATIECFVRLLVNLLVPAHSASFASGNFLPPVPSSNGGPVRRRHRTQQFTTHLLGRPVEWIIETHAINANASNASPVICSIRVHAPSLPASTIVRLRTCILRRMRKMLFGRDAGGFDVAGASFPAVSTRDVPKLNRDSSEPERDAHGWMIKYVSMGREAAAASAGDAPIPQQNGTQKFVRANPTVHRPQSSSLHGYFHQLATDLSATRAQLSKYQPQGKTGNQSSELGDSAVRMFYEQRLDAVASNLASIPISKIIG